MKEQKELTKEVRQLMKELRLASQGRAPLGAAPSLIPAPTMGPCGGIEASGGEILIRFKPTGRSA